MASGTQHQFLGHLHCCHGGNDQPTVGGSAVADGLEVFIEAKERVAVSPDQARRSGRVPDRVLGCLLTLELIVRSWDIDTGGGSHREVEDPRDVATAARGRPNRPSRVARTWWNFASMCWSNMPRGDRRPSIGSGKSASGAADVSIRCRRRA